MKKAVSAHLESLDINQSDERSKTIFGFWVYLMTDLVLFASLFATYAVLRNGTNGGPDGSEIFNLSYVFIETMLLLTSSLTIGLGLLELKKRKIKRVAFWLGATFILGLAFLLMELAEFSHLVSEGYAWHTSAFLSAYFTIIGVHGLHILAGLVWIIVMFSQLITYGLSDMLIRRMALLGFFWHFLDIVWIFIFSFVYLLGAV
jgi:cytochrome o ubiquinol oxidase subunit III